MNDMSSCWGAPTPTSAAWLSAFIVGASIGPLGRRPARPSSAGRPRSLQCAGLRRRGAQAGLARRGIAQNALARYYLERGYILVLGGDIEDLSKFRLREIRAAWYGLYAIFDGFAERGALRKILGSHDIALLREEGYP